MRGEKSQKTSTFNTRCHSVSGTVDILSPKLYRTDSIAILQC